VENTTRFYSGEGWSSEEILGLGYAGEEWSELDTGMTWGLDSYYGYDNFSDDSSDTDSVKVFADNNRSSYFSEYLVAAKEVVARVDAAMHDPELRKPVPVSYDRSWLKVAQKLTWAIEGQDRREVGVQLHEAMLDEVMGDDEAVIHFIKMMGRRSRCDGWETSTGRLTGML
jgi:hypothetical protein